FMFASELKAFHKHPKFKKELDLQVLGMFFRFSTILEPHTIFKRAKKLKAGNYLVFDLKTRSITEHQYWNVLNFYEQPKIQMREEDVLEETESILRSACSYRLVADVPVGVFLSGGYDSSVVTALLQSESRNKIQTFTIGFQEKEF